MFKNLTFVIVFLCSSVFVFAQESDSLKEYTLSQVEVSSKRHVVTDNNLTMEKDNLESIFENFGFTLIRKGDYFAKDIYSDGFKRADITVTVDGERYHSACPNRMDSPLSRINPLEVESVNLMKSSTSAQSGIAGKVDFLRSRPAQEWKVSAGLSQTAGAMEASDFALMAENKRQRLSVRYSQGLPYKNGDNNKFSDLYGFADNFHYRLAEASYLGEYNNLKYGASFSYAENISFPYLHMDEKFNRVGSAHLAYKNNKLYVNYTAHIMDNTLRVSPMHMVSEAENYTVGIVGENYELFFRRWDVDNHIVMMQNNIYNSLIPDLRHASGAYSYSFNFGELMFNTRLGLTYFSVNEENAKLVYMAVNNSETTERFFPIASLTSVYNVVLSKKSVLSFMGEVNTTAPEAENLFIAVKRPMANPDWSGNPDLDQPLKTGVKTVLRYLNSQVEIYYNHVFNYVNFIKKSGMKNYQTFGNVNAGMLGTNISLKYRYFTSNISYTYAQNYSNDKPLSEIAPLTVNNKIEYPVSKKLAINVKHIYNDAQLRVDESLNEVEGSAWNRFDLGVRYKFSNFMITADVENVLDEVYTRHLSYMRNPYSSGMQVFEPGRVFRINIIYNNLL